MKDTLYKIVAGITVLSLVGIFFNYSYDKNSFSTNEALGSANLATFEVLGGGGGGGVIASSGGGGGGGGQYHKCVGQPLRQKSYTVIVGVGGTIDTTGETDSWVTEYGSTSPLSLNADGGNGTSGVTAGTAGTSGTTTGCAGTITSYNGGTPGAGLTTNDTGGGGGGGAGYGGKGGNGASASTSSTTLGGGGGGGGGTGGAGGNASSRTGGTAGIGSSGTGGTGGQGEANGTAGSAGSTTAMYITGGGGGGGSGGPTSRVGGACGAPGAGSGGGEVTGAGNGCRGEVRISYVDSEVNATGGTETTNGIYRIHTFTTSGTFTVTSTKSPATVALNSPADASTTPDTTPELKFTGTDSVSADLRYNVQVDSVNTFNSQNNAWDVANAINSTTTIKVNEKADRITFSTDGTKMYVVDRSAKTIYQYTLGTAWDITTSVYANKATTTASTSSAIEDVVFSTDGTKMYTYDGGRVFDVEQYTLGTAWDITTSVYANKATATPQATSVNIFFSTDGTKMYTVAYLDNYVYQYTLGTAWDITTSVYSGKSFSVGTEISTAYDIYISDDGLNMIITGNYLEKVCKYTLGTAWDITTSTFSSPCYSMPFTNGLYTTWYSSDGYKLYTASIVNKPNRIYEINIKNPLINSVSGSNPGFSGTPDNTDPFTSAQEVVYTVQSALPDGTYYWRVKAGDPNATNEYGTWSSTRSFTISSGGISTPPYIEDIYFLQ